ncbi:MAG TPA: hypothetical protein VMH89_11405 [Candidatus Acidoferrum sp.]|nr:hypothetical protein [Candidatus Acidoferrum sp.]
MATETQFLGATPSNPNIFLLSPADSSGRRGRMLVNPKSQFELAQRLRTTGITLGEAYSFMSSLYFRGKLAYAAAFSSQSHDLPSIQIITPTRGLLSPHTAVNLADLAELGVERILEKNPRYRDPLERDLRKLSESLGTDGKVIFLGSLGTKRYIPLLKEILGHRILIPRDFLGMGNMQRGAVLLRCVREHRQLTYVTLADTEIMRRQKPASSKGQRT